MCIRDSVLYHVVNDRHIRRRSIVFTTNKHPKRWGSVLHDDDLAEAIVDRILERGRLLRLDGPSVRTKHLPEGELQDDDHGDSAGRRVSGIEAAKFPERTNAVRADLIQDKVHNVRQRLSIRPMRHWISGAKHEGSV